MTTTKTDLPTLAELESLEAAGKLERRHTLQARLRKLRAERAEDEQAAIELVSARADLVAHEQRAAVEVVTLPSEGDDSCALLLALRGLGGDSRPLAVEQRDGRTTEYYAAECVAFVPGDAWKRLGPQVRSALRRAHPQRPGKPWGFIVAAPGEPRDDLLALVGEQHHVAMARERLVVNLALALPACSIAARWYRSALDSRDAAAPAVVHALRATFARAGRVHELNAASAAE